MKWKTGEPYFIGWWRTTSEGRYVEEWRWWDGKQWSIVVYPNDRPEYINIFADMKVNMQGIKWSTYYPTNARVPRKQP